MKAMFTHTKTITSVDLASMLAYQVYNKDYITASNQIFNDVAYINSVYLTVIGSLIGSLIEGPKE